MYFPYLRGKQFELLAIKELADLLGRHKTVTPLIEPVRPPKGSGLDRCVDALSREGLDFVLIVNPTVGELRGQVVSQVLVDHVNDADPDEHWGLGLIIDENTESVPLVQEYQQQFGARRRLSLVHKGYARDLGQLPTAMGAITTGYSLINHTLRRSHYRALPAFTSSAILSDPFPSEERNSDYLTKAESMFTEDHLFYAEEGWSGFADYVTIGEPYGEGGFTPRAVAIHWTYEPQTGSPIMIRHFTSASDPGTTADVGGKFLEAAQKLVTFLDAEDIHTRASEIMRGHLRDQTYPGLGIVKKLSIQNHLELVSGILSRL